MRVALVYPILKGGGHSCNPPLALLYLATNLERDGHEVAIFDRDRYPHDPSSFMAEIVDYSPDLIGMPLFTIVSILKAVRQFCQTLREKLPRTPILLGGPHISAMPEQTLEWFPEADFALQGEADITLGMFVKELEGNAAEPKAPGLFYRKNGGITSIPRIDPPKDLDALPIPDRKFLKKNFDDGIYWRLDRSGPTDLILTGRGCPFNCNFCFKTEKGYRPRGAENVLQELEYLASLGHSNIDIEDDLFTANKKRCITICQGILEAGFKFSLKVRSRVDTIDEEMLSAMRKAGVETVVYGFESGSDRILKAMNKKTTAQRNRDVVRMTKKAGLKCHADIILGFPGEDEESIRETEKFLVKSRPTSMLISVMMPWPKTKVYEDGKEDGSLVGDWTIDGPPPYIKLPWMDDYSTLWDRSKVVNQRFYSDPRVIFNLVRHSPLNMRVIKAGSRFLYSKVRGK